MTKIKYSLIREWMSASGARETGSERALKPAERALLFSDGSMTVRLESLTGKEISAEVAETGLAALSAGDAAYLGEKPSSAALQRKVWLKAGAEKLIYAVTLIPIERVEEGLLKELHAGRPEPLGRILGERNIRITKERIETAIICSLEASAGLSIDPSTPLFARRYLLNGRGGGGSKGEGMIKAAVLEIFSPRLLPLPYLGS